MPPPATASCAASVSLVELDRFGWRVRSGDSHLLRTPLGKLQVPASRASASVSLADASPVPEMSNGTLPRRRRSPSSPRSSPSTLSTSPPSSSSTPSGRGRMAGAACPRRERCEGEAAPRPTLACGQAHLASHQALLQLLAALDVVIKNPFSPERPPRTAMPFGTHDTRTHPQSTVADTNEREKRREREREREKSAARRNTDGGGELRRGTAAGGRVHVCTRQSGCRAYPWGARS
mmetsp:Transcript_27062/g.86979  ORF Transcript_27062/g.86979 Transcript_27062/m.86979 type:complete len:235 (+) Transcript_27062:2-706(+)